jgi:hypothetical protein
VRMPNQRFSAGIRTAAGSSGMDGPGLLAVATEIINNNDCLRAYTASSGAHGCFIVIQA